MKSLRSPEHLRLMELLIEARNKAGLTQEQVASKLGKRQSFVAKYEGGERRLDVVEFIWVARAIQFSGGNMVREIEAEYTVSQLALPAPTEKLLPAPEEDDPMQPALLPPPGRKPSKP